MATNPRTAAFAALLVVCGLSHTTRAAPPAAAISSAAVTAQPQFAASVAMSPEDQATSDAFKRHGIPVPSARSTAELQKKLEASGALRAAVEKARAVADPQPAKRDAAITEIGKLAGNQAANIMEVL